MAAPARVRALPHRYRADVLTPEEVDRVHTLAHMAELWRSRILDDSSWEEWEAAGEPDAVARAEAEARRLLAEHEPEPLDEDLARELERIVAAYEAQALGG